MNRVRPSSAKCTLERSDSGEPISSATAEVVSALLRVPSAPVRARTLPSLTHASAAVEGPWCGAASARPLRLLRNSDKKMRGQGDAIINRRVLVPPRPRREPAQRLPPHMLRRGAVCIRPLRGAQGASCCRGKGSAMSYPVVRRGSTDRPGLVVSRYALHARRKQGHCSAKCLVQAAPGPPESRRPSARGARPAAARARLLSLHPAVCRGSPATLRVCARRLEPGLPV